MHGWRYTDGQTALLPDDFTAHDFFADDTGWGLDSEQHSDYHIPVPSLRLVHAVFGTWRRCESQTRAPTSPLRYLLCDPACWHGHISGGGCTYTGVHNLFDEISEDMFEPDHIDTSLEGVCADTDVYDSVDDVPVPLIEPGSTDSEPPWWEFLDVPAGD